MVTSSEYIFFVFLASIGVIQLAALRSRLKGLLFTSRPVPACVLSLLLIFGSYYWFFQRDSRIDMIMRKTGLEGKQQFFSFCTAAFLALAFTLIVTSLLGIIRNKRQINAEDNNEGLDSLRNKTYVEAIKQSFSPEE